jgi:hypothetical protein
MLITAADGVPLKLAHRDTQEHLQQYSANERLVSSLKN